ncbi:ThiF family adenylyltransferase [Candidatus Saccharibacteria bacterium]|nr:ThiF family adenylyltransferase [Candidatus Saccharibacteria bacterium]
MGEKRLTTRTDDSSVPNWLKEAEKASVISDSFVSKNIKPIILNMNIRNADNALRDLCRQVEITRFIDVFDEQLAELFISDNAQLYKASLQVKRSSVRDYLKNYKKGKSSWQLGSWVYYPWSGTLIHMLSEDEFIKLRTIRNQFIITADEQEKYASYSVGCAGMSVGSNGAVAIAITGGSQRIKLADGAVFSGSNLNRVRTGVKSVGLPKSIIIGRELYEMNPYLRIDAITENLSDKNITRFFDKPWKLDAVVDEIDDVIIKIKLRLEARKRKIPVIMVTEPGDTVMLDVERFDKDDSLPLFHGLLKDAERIAEAGSFKNERERIKSIVKIIGTRNLPVRDQQAALKVGSVIPSAPQLGSTAMIAGGVISYAIRQLATDAPLRSGRHAIDLNKIFWKPKDYLRYKINHETKTRNLNRVIGNM